MLRDFERRKTFYFYWSKMPQNLNYCTENKDACPEDVRFHGINKFPKNSSSMYPFLIKEYQGH